MLDDLLLSVVEPETSCGRGCITSGRPAIEPPKLVFDMAEFVRRCDWALEQRGGSKAGSLLASWKVG